MGAIAGGVSAAASAAAGRPVLVHSFEQWRHAARDLLAHKVPPHAVQWISHKDDGDLFSQGAQAQASSAVQPDSKSTMRISRQLMDMLQSAACCRVPNRWAFLYLVLWRWQQGEKEVLSAADEDGARLHTMVKAVHREEHDMHAYIRFRERREDAGPPRFVAWFEPAHDVLPQVARHFASRMGKVTWMIATPEASVLWDGATLHSTGPLMRGPEDIDDAGEALWLTYYRSIFNPARLNADLMRGHIPRRFWKNLPEGALVPGMVSQAAAGARRVGQTYSVGQRGGTVIPISADKAQPQRAAPSTLDQCRRCELWQNATQAVGGVGPLDARIMLVGEQPGDQEDLAGLPFVGPAGQLLDRAMDKAELDRRTIYLTNAVKHFKWEPRGKRRMHKTPAQREIDACSYWLGSELEQVRPEVVVALGSTALKAVTGNPHATLKEVLGKPFMHEGRWVVVVYHPSYILRVPGEDMKAQAFAVMVDGFRRARELALPVPPP
ncbi:UdgX family uracil-DNA binding protein [Massilia sp. P8910]|uniref:UdgX family uracil-DNA binding protein n=1 Tax=Massilia antarctica TaxID=2765360 RepID=UPI001E58D51D|nr:UdgX family uracil-DNA binding protein [Massilia antarctica]MCE3607226.1 UdgX family uracil-DNA binding protein [Massilia antarctica]